MNIRRFSKKPHTKTVLMEIICFSNMFQCLHQRTPLMLVSIEFGVAQRRLCSYVEYVYLAWAYKLENEGAQKHFDEESILYTPWEYQLFQQFTSQVPRRQTKLKSFEWNSEFDKHQYESERDSEIQRRINNTFAWGNWLKRSTNLDGSIEP